MLNILQGLPTGNDIADLASGQNYTVPRSIRAIPLGGDVYYRRHSNAVHPSDVGYNQMGDSLYAFLKYIKNL